MVRVSIERCQPWRVKKARCRLCLEACPVDACITFEENILSINESACNGCGICTAACPSGALTLEGLSDGALAGRVLASEKKKVLFGCALGPAGHNQADAEKDIDAIRLGCMAIANESVLAGLVLSGVEEISLLLDGCSTCGFKKGKEIIEGSMRRAENLLSAFRLSGRIRPACETGKDGKSGRPVWRELKPGPVYSRRELFSFFRGTAEVHIAEKKETGTNAWDAIAGKRAVLMHALKGAVPQATDTQIGIGAFPVRSLSIGEGCTLCGRCEAFCPTGALKRIEEAEEVRIDFDMGLCAGCFECAEFCPSGALAYNGSLRPDGMRGPASTLLKKKIAQCPVCGSGYLPDVDPACPVCGKRERLERRINTIIFGNQV